MPWSRLSGSVITPKVDVDGFLKIGTVTATRAVAEDAYHVLRKGNISQHNFAHTLKKICKEGVYWGIVARVYVGMEYGAERIHGKRDWKNAMMGGAVTSALVSAANNNNKDKIMMDAITSCAVATAAEFLNYLVRTDGSNILPYLYYNTSRRKNVRPFTLSFLRK